MAQEELGDLRGEAVYILQEAHPSAWLLLCESCLQRAGSCELAFGNCTRCWTNLVWQKLASTHYSRLEANSLCYRQRQSAVSARQAQVSVPGGTGNSEGIHSEDLC